MRKRKCAISFWVCALAGSMCTMGQTYTAHTLAGGWPANMPADSAWLGSIGGLTADSAGNVYLSLTDYNVVVRVDQQGGLTKVAGNGARGSLGDGGPAIAAELNEPRGLALDASGNLYIADAGNYRVRKVANGVITTFAGDGYFGNSGNGGPAAAARFFYPWGLAVDADGNLFVSDASARTIRRVANGIITQVARIASGDVYGIALDAAGNVYAAVSDHRVVKVSGGEISTFAGNGQEGHGGDGGPATSAYVPKPSSVAADAAGDVYISQAWVLGAVRKVSNGIISTVEERPGPFFHVMLGSQGALYFDDPGRVYRIANGVKTAVAGATASPSDGPAPTAQLTFPRAIAVDKEGGVYFSDNSGLRVRKILNGVLATVAGNGTSGTGGDGGPAVNAQFTNVGGIAVDDSGGLYIADENRIRQVSNGIITTLAQFESGRLSGVAVQGGDVYVVDRNTWIRKISQGTVSLVAGNGQSGTTGDGGPALAASIFADGIATDTGGSLYLFGRGRIRQISGGVITTAVASASGNAFAVGSRGEFYTVSGFIDFWDLWIEPSLIHKRTRSASEVIAGTGDHGFAGDGGDALKARFSSPGGIAVDTAGRIFVADTYSHRIRVLVPSGATCAYSVSPVSPQLSEAGGSVAVQVSADLSCPWTVTALPAWITVAGPENGIGTAPLTFVVAANTGPARSATMLIGGQPVTVSQASACMFSASAGGQAFTSAGSAGSFMLATGAACSWTASSGVPWVTITGAASGSGNAAITFFVAANTGAGRTGIISVGGVSFTIEQASAITTGLVNNGAWPQIAVAGRWSTRLTVVNSSPATRLVRFNFYANDGAPLTLSLTFPHEAVSGASLLAFTLDRMLSPGAVLEIAAAGAAEGWGELLSDGYVSGYATLVSAGGGADYRGSIPLVQPGSTPQVFTFDNTGGLVTGLALANPGGQARTITALVRDHTGAVLMQTGIALAAREHVSFVMPWTYGPTEGKRGTVEFTGGAAAAGIAFNTLTGGFAVIPPLSAMPTSP